MKNVVMADISIAFKVRQVILCFFMCSVMTQFGSGTGNAINSLRGNGITTSSRTRNKANQAVNDNGSNLYSLPIMHLENIALDPLSLTSTVPSITIKQQPLNTNISLIDKYIGTIKLEMGNLSRLKSREISSPEEHADETSVLTTFTIDTTSLDFTVSSYNSSTTQSSNISTAAASTSVSSPSLQSDNSGSLPMVKTPEDGEGIKNMKAPVVKTPEDGEGIQNMKASVVKTPEDGERIQHMKAPVVKTPEDREGIYRT